MECANLKKIVVKRRREVVVKICCKLLNKRKKVMETLVGLLFAILTRIRDVAKLGFQCFSSTKTPAHVRTSSMEDAEET